jgi:hypothetical protein
LYQKAMSALGWELPLDTICINGSFAQKVYFAKSHERPRADSRQHPASTECRPQSGHSC